MIIKENKRFKLVFERYLKKSSVTTYGGSSYSGNGYSGSYYSRYDGIPIEDRITLYFYEWSSMSKGSKCFYSLSKFKEFLEENNIEYNVGDLNAIKHSSFIYAVCEPGKAKLLTDTNYYQLKCKLEKMEKERENIN